MSCIKHRLRTVGASVLFVAACEGAPSNREIDAGADVLSRNDITVPVEVIDSDGERERRAAKIEEYKQTIEALLLSRRPELRSLIELEPPTDTVKVLQDGRYEIEISKGSDGRQLVTTLGAEDRYATIAKGLERFHSIDNQRAIYSHLISRTAERCRDGQPQLAELDALSVDDLIQLNEQLAQCTVEERLPHAGSTHESEAPPALPAGEILGEPPLDAHPGDYGGPPGQHFMQCEDRDGLPPLCMGGIWFHMNWLGKAHDTPVKSQAGRGTCTSFAIAGAMENAIARMSGQRTNMSEQWIYAMGRLHDDPARPSDGLNLVTATQAFELQHWNVPFESTWPYNPSPARVLCPEDGARCAGLPWGFSYSCHDKDGSNPYTGGYCGDTAHQARRVCSSQGSFCYWTVPTSPGDSGYDIDKSVWLWGWGSESPNLVLAMQMAGYSVAVSFDTSLNFDLIKQHSAGGLWQHPEPFFVRTGSHAVQVSGVISNAALPAHIPDGAGGGWVAIKNSWGSGWGDAGYIYMSIEGLGEVIHGATALLPKRRGQNQLPTLDVISPAPDSKTQLGFAAPPTMFKAKASDLEDGDDCCVIEWTSNIQGALGTGRNVSKHMYVGDHLITVTATDSEGGVSKRSFALHAAFDPPTAQIIAPREGETVYVGEQIAISSSASTNVDCADVRWSSSVASDSIHNKFGCDFVTHFSSTGPRVLTLKATDKWGMSTTATVKIMVENVPVGSPPVVNISAPFGTSQAAYYVDVENAPGKQLSFVSSTISPGEYARCQDASGTNCLRVSWTADGKVLSTKDAFMWDPGTQFPFVCGGYTIEVELCATDPNGKSCTSTFLHLGYGPC